MKALTMLQPWAQLLMLGVRAYDIRRWRTTYRGPILIHAGLDFSDAARELCTREPLRSLLAQGGFAMPAHLPRGAFVGTVTVTDCIRTDRLLFDRMSALPKSDLHPGRWAWMFSKPRRLKTPVPYRGVLGLFEVPISKLASNLASVEA